MAGYVYSEQTNIDDIVRWDLNQWYCRANVTVWNRLGSTLVNATLIGQPLRPDSSVAGDYMLMLATQESYTTALLLRKQGFVNNQWLTATSIRTKALVRGPAIVDKVWLPPLDPLGGTFTIATICTALNALNPSILTPSELTPSVTQTT